MPNLDIIYGDIANPVLLRGLVDELQTIDPVGTLYLGYPVLASADARVNIDALLITEQHGLVAFLMGSAPGPGGTWDALVDQQDDLYGALESYLGRHKTLRQGRRLAFDIITVTLLPAAPPGGTELDDAEGHYVDLAALPALLGGLAGTSEPIRKRIEAAVHKVTTIRPAKRRQNVQRADSRGGKLKAIEKEIANLDRWQKRSAIEVPDGVQRIRGLAGSGKTVVLALKAAYLHAQHPDWRIAITFYSRALYQQLEDLIRRFSFEHILDEPDWDRLQVLHSWGSLRDKAGLYTAIAVALGQPVRDWGYAKRTYGKDDAFAGICRELLSAAKARSSVEPLFDAVLIDEAQDLPQEFFELIALFTSAPHRIAFAYDELQQLDAGHVRPVEELFGTNEAGEPRLRLGGTGPARDDIVLPVCYRNPPWTLTVAHAIGFGIYRDGGLVQHFDNPVLWKEVGYKVIGGDLKEGDEVTLARDDKSFPSFFPEQLEPADVVQFRAFEKDAEQLAWVAQSIKNNIESDELDPDDILIVLPSAYTSKHRAMELIRVLSQHGVSANHVGATSSQDKMFTEGTVSITHIYRAKGNEAAMVYVVDAEYGVGSPWASTQGLASRRNVLFTAITRARAWVRVSGTGAGMAVIKAEFDQVVTNNYSLRFPIPTEEERARLRQLHRDRSEAEAASRREVVRSVKSALEALESGDIDFHELPPELQERLRRVMPSVDDEA